LHSEVFRPKAFQWFVEAVACAADLKTFPDFLFVARLVPKYHEQVSMIRDLVQAKPIPKPIVPGLEIRKNSETDVQSTLELTVRIAAVGSADNAETSPVHGSSALLVERVRHPERMNERL
jgi:hypothetical protein